ncbi:flagellar transcriptional regulator FlhD [Paraburkholderia caribensis]|uniref:flagellar transcriptional regulator FlhD n=1 Tax=Paraburkholderia caribensis TaxID=75105 RepID=UPI00078D38AA|nr:flagellar transcriptional regulator FlhD [Paraburkholderia caribensis]AMV43010.1 transcriptional regulator [Paraburkholderia caribensis]MDR6380266.1 flagellar transcriptional activator FlhD [Paraburkholderia caribensis]
MDHNETLNEIREVNLSFLLLAQRLARVDSPMAMRLLRVGEESLKEIASLPPEQIARLAATNVLFCRFALDDCALLASLAHGVPRGVERQTAEPLAA